MTNVVINLCGVKSKGGITVVNNYLAQNKTKNLYVIYDNLDIKKYIENLLILEFKILSLTKIKIDPTNIDDNGTKGIK